MRWYLPHRITTGTNADCDPRLAKKSIALDASDVEGVKRSLLIAHLFDGTQSVEKTAELVADVGRTHSISILWQLAALVLADAQTSHFLAPLGLDFHPRSRRCHALAARLRRVVLSRERDDEALGQLAHEPNANRGWIALLDAGGQCASRGAPRAIRQDERALVPLLVDGA